jgi:hypothetical protein
MLRAVARERFNLPVLVAVVATLATQLPEKSA